MALVPSSAEMITPITFRYHIIAKKIYSNYSCAQVEIIRAFHPAAAEPRICPGKLSTKLVAVLTKYYHNNFDAFQSSRQAPR